MDASQYKDYVLVLLFLKYVSDKYAAALEAKARQLKQGMMQELLTGRIRVV